MAFPHYIDATERRIIGKLVKKALKTGYHISVFDGEEWPVKRSTDYEAITNDIAATGETTLMFRKPDGEKVGWVLLIHGNGEDVVSDFSDNAAMDSLTA